MTSCKHIKGRIVPVSCNMNDDLSSIPVDRFYIALVESGCAVINLDGEKYHLNGHNILCLDHFSKCKLEISKNIIVNSCSFAPSFINVNLNWDIFDSFQYGDLCKEHDFPQFRLFREKSILYNGVIPIEANLFGFLKEYIGLISKEALEQPDLMWSCKIRGYILRICDMIDDYLQSFLSIETEDTLIVQVCQYLSRHFQEQIRIQKLCELCAINRTYLAKRFREHAGITIADYLVEKRISHAKHLLAFTSLPLATVAQNSGFPNVSYFSRTMKEITGKTPLQYRRKCLEGRKNLKIDAVCE